MGKDNVMQQWANQGALKLTSHSASDPSSGLIDADISRLQKTPQGRQFLIKASSLPSGSAMMKDIVSQAQKFLATGEADYR
jgi:hypothetical protein